MTIIRCETSECKGKIIGQLESGRNVHFFCKKCKHTTIVTIEAVPPAADSIGVMPKVTTKEGQRT